MTDERRRAWESRMGWPLIAAAGVFLAAYAWPILDTELSRTQRALCGTVIGIVWFVFLVDYVVRLVLAEKKARFVRNHVLDLASVALPLLRPLQLLRLLRALTVLDKKLGESLRGRVGVYVGITTAITLAVASLTILDLERDRPGANIQSFGDAVWWCLTTMTTVGYGDLYPVTTGGRTVAVALMVFGVGLLGIVTASMASYLVERFSDNEEAERLATQEDLRLLTQEVRELRSMLGNTEAGGPRTTGSDTGVNDGT